MNTFNAINATISAGVDASCCSPELFDFGIFGTVMPVCTDVSAHHLMVCFAVLRLLPMPSREYIEKVWSENTSRAFISEYQLLFRFRHWLDEIKTQVRDKPGRRSLLG